MRSLSLILLYINITPLLFNAECAGSLSTLKFESSDVDAWGELPQHLVNIASFARIRTNATCGDAWFGPETYCQPVGSLDREYKLNCSVCSLGENGESYQILNALQDSRTWWQSPTLARGPRFNWVTITLDLRQMYQVAHIIIKSGNSPRPGNWILERSIDGKEYFPWKYFASTEDECRRWIEPQSVGLNATREDGVECLTEFSRPEPIHHGEIRISLPSKDPGAKFSLWEVPEFSRARYVRLRLQKMQIFSSTFNGSNNIMDHVESLPPNSYYYSISSITILGSCACYGYGSRCIKDYETMMLKCDCGGNTCGENCEECCPTFDRLQWPSETHPAGVVCGECTCYGHSNVCAYGGSVSRRHSSFNSHGARAICVNCKNQTTGVNCESCMDGFYRSTSNKHAPCTPCPCDCPGCSGECVKEALLRLQGMDAIRCLCREGFSGALCNQCSPGYHGYPECRLCTCDNVKPHQVNGGCSCKTRGLQDWMPMSLNPQTTQRLEFDGVLGKCLYFSAPRAFLRDKINSYGGILRYIYNCEGTSNDHVDDDGDDGDDDDEQQLPHVIIEGGGLALGRKALHGSTQGGLREVRLMEHGWVSLGQGHIWNCSDEDKCGFGAITKDDFMHTLSHVTGLWVRTHCRNHHQDHVWLEMAGISDEQDDGPLPVESQQHLHGYPCEDCQNKPNEVINLCKMCLPSCHGNSCMPSKGEFDKKGSVTQNFQNEVSKRCSLRGDESREHSLHSSVPNVKNHLGCSRCSCLLCIFEKSLNRNPNLEEDCLRSNGSTTIDACTCCNGCSCPFDKPIIKDIKSCGEDSCFEELLLNVHAILHLTDCISLTFNPWNKLDWMNQSLTSLQDEFKKLTFMDVFREDLFLQQLIHVTNNQAEDLLVTFDEAKTNLSILLDQIKGNMTRLQRNHEVIQSVLHKLKHDSKAPVHDKSNFNSKSVFDASQILLERVKSVNVSTSSALQELEAARSLRARVVDLVRASTTTNNTSEVLTTIEKNRAKFDDIRHFSVDASLVSTETKQLNEHLKQMLSDLEHLEEDVDDLERETQGCLGGEIANREARMLVGGLKSVYDEHGIDDFTSLSQMLGKKVKKWSKERKNLQPSLLRALEKCGNLSDEVSTLDGMNFNLSFSNLAQKNEVLQKLKSGLATLLSETLNVTTALHVASQFDESVSASTEVHDFTSLDDILAKADEVAQKFKNISSIINFLNDTSGWSFENVVNNLESFQNNSSASNTSFLLNQITSKIQSINQSETRIEEIVLSISRNSSDIGGSIANQADKLNSIGRELNITVKSLDANVKELLSGASLMSERVERLKKFEQELTREVMTLKNTLKYARGRAANVHVPLCHKGGCIRSYPLAERSTLSNLIEFSFRTNSARLNQLLLLIHDGGNSKFMAVELVSGKIRFSWRIGDETNMMETSEEITFHDELTWYRVRAERIGHIGKLMVHDMNVVGEEEEEEELVRRFQPSMTPFHFKPSMEFFIGGVPHDYQLPIDLSSRDFSGCIGEVVLDESPVGMFDFRKLLSSSSQTCYGSPLVTHKEHALASKTFQFDGSGHVIMRPLNEVSLESIIVSLTFKSFWGNSFLFGSVDDSTGEFIKLGLKDGHVVFKYGWPLRNLRVVLVSKRVYNSNHWVKVYARRTNLQGVLRVENEDLKSPLHDSPVYDSLNLSDSSIFFGGVPPYVVHEELIGSTSFLGCMKDININSVVPHFLDISEGSHTGMRTGCSQHRMTLSGFMGSSSSFLELEFHLESPSPTFSFLFKTSSPGALLLLSINEDHQLAFLVQLSNKGGLEVLLRWNERLLRFEHHRNLCDNARHFVSAYEDQERLKLTVDQVVLRESYVDDWDGFHFSCSNVLFVGGVPTDVLDPHLEGTFQSFNGCISEVIVNNILLTFENPKSFKDADIGRCQTQKSSLFQTPLVTTPFSPTLLLQPQSSTTVSHVIKKTSALTVSGLARTSAEYATPFVNKFDEIANVLPLDSKSQHCSFKKAYHYEPHAVSFGASQASYVVLDLREHTDINRFTISFYMRTHHEEGALLHSSSRDSFAWSISLMLGHLVVVQSHHGGEKQMETKERYNRGQWVRLDVSLKDDIVKIVVDKNEEIILSTNSLGFENLHIGRRPPESYYDFDASIFRGCIANFSINNELIHLANSPNMVGLLPCHSNIEKGAFFDGYAYALFAEHFHFKSFLTISFNMKLYQPNGVLFAMSDFHRFATLVIFMSEEQVIFKVSDYDSMYSVESEHCPDCLCDGSWHQVVAELFSDSITLRIDGQISIGTKFGSTIDLELEGRLYIGGNPAPIGPLMMPESGDFFSGCLANIRINDEPIDWLNAEELFGVHLSGCPILS